MLEVQDYGVSNSYIFTGTQDKSGKTGELRHDFALITESEYGSLTSAQKNVCKKLSDPVYRTMELSDGSVVPAYDAQNTNKCVYGVPAYYYTKATELGLRTLVMGIRDERTIREFLEIPAQETIVSVIGVGYPDIEPSMPKRKTIEEVSTFY